MLPMEGTQSDYLEVVEATNTLGDEGEKESSETRWAKFFFGFPPFGSSLLLLLLLNFVSLLYLSSLLQKKTRHYFYVIKLFTSSNILSWML